MSLFIEVPEVLGGRLCRELGGKVRFAVGLWFPGCYKDLILPSRVSLLLADGGLGSMAQNGDHKMRSF